MSASGERLRESMESENSRLRAMVAGYKKT